MATLPSTGPLSLLDIKTAFSGGNANPISLNSYHGRALAVPPTGLMSIGNFLGADNTFFSVLTPSSLSVTVRRNQQATTANTRVYRNLGAFGASTSPFTHQWGVMIDSSFTPTNTVPWLPGSGEFIINSPTYDITSITVNLVGSNREVGTYVFGAIGLYKIVCRVTDHDGRVVYSDGLQMTITVTN